MKRRFRQFRCERRGGMYLDVSSRRIRAAHVRSHRSGSADSTVNGNNRAFGSLLSRRPPFFFSSLCPCNQSPRGHGRARAMREETVTARDRITVALIDAFPLPRVRQGNHVATFTAVGHSGIPMKGKFVRPGSRRRPRRVNSANKPRP